MSFVHGPSPASFYNETSALDDPGNGTWGNGTTETSETPQPPGMSSEDIAVCICLLLMAMCTVFGNSLVIHAVRIEKRLQTVSNYYIVSLACADLIVGLVAVPMNIPTYILPQWTLGEVTCYIWVIMDYTCCLSSILHLLVLSLDRYWSITQPLKYMRRRTKKRALVKIVLAWAFAFLWVLIPAVGWERLFGKKRVISEDLFIVDCSLDFQQDLYFNLATAVVIFFTPFLVMSIVYIRIFYEIRKSSKNVNLGRRRSTNRKHRTHNHLHHHTTFNSLEQSPCASPMSRRNLLTSLSEPHLGDSETLLQNGGRFRPALRRTMDSPVKLTKSLDLGRTDSNGSLDIPSTYRGRPGSTPPECRRLLTNSPQRTPPGGPPQPCLRANLGPGPVATSSDIELRIIAIDGNSPTHSAHSNKNSEDTDSAASLLGSPGRTGLGPRYEVNNGSVCSSPLASPVRRNLPKRTLVAHEDGTLEILNEDRTGKTTSRYNSAKRFFLAFQFWKGRGESKAGYTSAPTLDTLVDSPRPQNNNKECVFKRVSFREDPPLKKQKRKTSRKNVAGETENNRKAAVQLVLVMGCFVACWMPLFTQFIVNAACSSCVSPTFIKAAIMIAYANSMFNPIIYTACNIRFRQAFRKTLTCQ